MTASKQKIVQNSLTFLRNRTKVLIFGSSNVILHVLNEAYKRKIDLEVYIPECKGTNEGIDFYKKLSKIGFTCKLIYDSTIGYCLEECDMVLVGAEAVVENGGIINRAGTYTTALCCKILKKPFYVLAESFKFARLFPLSQKDLTDNI